MTLREKISKNILLLDGAFGTYIASKESGGRAQSPSGSMEELSSFSPGVISGIHADYFDAGADAVETNSFGGNRLKLAEYGLSKEVYSINLESARLARREADRFSTDKWPRYVVGTMGPTGKLPSSPDPQLGDIGYAELRDIFSEQAAALIDGGVDAILVETGQDILEMKAAVNGAKKAISAKKKDIVLMAHATLANNGRMLLGTEVSAFMAVMTAIGTDVVGINCSTGPAEMEGAVSFLGNNAPCYVSCVPNAGLPFERNGKTVFPMSPEEMAEIMSGFLKKYRIDVVGGCCGTCPEHIRAMRKVLGTAGKKHVTGRYFSASSYRGFDIKTMPRPIKVGERMNTQGSRGMKEMLTRRDYDSIVELGKTQERQGADILDLCVALTERSTEKEDAAILVKRLAQSVEVPVMIDSTDPEVVERALENYPGTAFINSINLEDGGKKALRILELAREHGSFVVCLAIDEKGMAGTVERKLEVADRIYGLAVEGAGISPGRLIFDLLTFALSTGESEYRCSAVDTIKAVGKLKEKHPLVLAVLGVSNVSFGFSGPSRKTLNMAFLGAAAKSGLDMAIVNPAEYMKADDLPERERKLAEDLIFNSHDGALQDFIEHFASQGKAGARAPQDKPAENLSIEERITRCVLSRDSSAILPLMDEALKKYTADVIITEILMGTMKLAGEKLDKGEMVLPYVLQAAEVMKKAIEHLEGKLSGDRSVSRGKVILATVEGDVHDIGKNLVKMLLANNGFTVIDLGKQVSVERIIEATKREKPDAVGLSALLVSTSRHMRTCVGAMHDAGLEYPIIVGGSPVNERFARDISFAGNGSLYKGGVFYAKDAFMGLGIIKALVDKNEKSGMMRKYLSTTAPVENAGGIKTRSGSGNDISRRKVCGVPFPPFYGVRAIDRIPADEVMMYLNKKFLFEVSWGTGKKSPQGREKLIREEYEPALEEIKEEALRNNWLDLKAVYGYFRCRVKGTEMSVLGESGEEIASFDFRSESSSNGIYSYFAEEDLAIFQAVTIGGKLTQAVGNLSDKGFSARAYYLHGFGVNLAEALAQYVHSRILKELGLRGDRGKRYSPGYPLWPDLKDQEKLFRILEVTERIGVSLTSGYQMVPEQSTTAIIVHCDKAEY